MSKDIGIETIEINGVEYVKKADIEKPAESMDGMEYCIIRTYSAGVFAGYLYTMKGQEAVVKQARRLWRWSGAASLSQLAMVGTNKPTDCKFPCEVTSVTLTQVIEVIPCTETAKQSIAQVKIWQS